MTDLTTTADAPLATSTVKVLLYSDDRNVRETVRMAVGSTVSGATIEWTETATHDGTIIAVDANRYDLLILDGEAAKSGGMGLCRQIKHEIYDAPKMLLLVGRPGDAWLATWSEADAAVSHPLDPEAVREAVAETLAA